MTENLTGNGLSKMWDLLAPTAEQLIGMQGLGWCHQNHLTSLGPGVLYVCVWHSPATLTCGDKQAVSSTRLASHATTSSGRGVLPSCSSPTTQSSRQKQQRCRTLGSTPCLSMSWPFWPVSLACLFLAYLWPKSKKTFHPELTSTGVPRSLADVKCAAGPQSCKLRPHVPATWLGSLILNSELVGWLRRP